MNEAVTVVKLFKQLEALRLINKLAIEDVAFMVDVTPLAYKNWKNHDTLPQADREPLFRKAIRRLEKKYRKSAQQS